MFHLAPPEVSGLGVMTGDLVRIAGAHGEDHDRVGHHAFVLVGAPVLGDQTRFDEAIDVRGQRESHDVGGQTALDGAALLAGGGIGGVERNPGALGRRLEEGDDLLVGLARRGVGDEGQRDILLRQRGAGQRGTQRRGCRGRDQRQQRLAAGQRSLDVQETVV